LGAAKKKLARLILAESAVITGVGSVIGIAAASLAVFPFEVRLRESISLPYAELPVTSIALTAAVSFFLSAAVGPLAALFSLKKILKADTVDIIREDLR
jgi:putative ABC transport system permease protein